MRVCDPQSCRVNLLGVHHREPTDDFRHLIEDLRRVDRIRVRLDLRPRSATTFPILVADLLDALVDDLDDDAERLRLRLPNAAILERAEGC
jgi:hypothetical protein